jgi:hypothetical protein
MDKQTEQARELLAKQRQEEDLRQGTMRFQKRSRTSSV